MHAEREPQHYNYDIHNSVPHHNKISVGKCYGPNKAQPVNTQGEAAHSARAATLPPSRCQPPQAPCPKFKLHLN